MRPPVLKIKKTHPNAVVPRRATAGAAAVDLSAALDERVVIPPGGTAVVSTGIAIELPSDGYVALIFPRSGLGFHHGVTLVNSVGVIDSDYRGDILLGLRNHSDRPFEIESGDRLAQMLVTGAVFLPVEVVGELSDTGRGEGGFGSTGVAAEPAGGIKA